MEIIGHLKFTEAENTFPAAADVSGAKRQTLMSLDIFGLSHHTDFLVQNTSLKLVKWKQLIILVIVGKFILKFRLYFKCRSEF